jgi:hypothetical protein
MTLKVVKVKLNNKGTLDVADSGGLEFDPAKGVQIIAWSLSGNALANAWFPDDKQLPAFTWIDTPDPLIFSRPAVTGNGRRVLVDNDHLNLGTQGQWIYMLRVAYQKADGGIDYYTTTVTRTSRDGTRLSTNPIIINH